MRASAFYRGHGAARKQQAGSGRDFPKLAQTFPADHRSTRRLNLSAPAIAAARTRLVKQKRTQSPGSAPDAFNFLLLTLTTMWCQSLGRAVRQGRAYRNATVLRLRGVRPCQTFDQNIRLYQHLAQIREALATMRKIIGTTLIVLSLAGCAGGELPGDSAWSRDYWKIIDKKQSAG